MNFNLWKECAQRFFFFGICFTMGIVGKCTGVCAMEENGLGGTENSMGLVMTCRLLNVHKDSVLKI